MAVLKTYTPRASAAVWHSDSDAMTWLPVHAVAERRYAWLRATSTRARSRRIQGDMHSIGNDSTVRIVAQIFDANLVIGRKSRLILVV